MTIFFPSIYSPAFPVPSQLVSLCLHLNFYFFTFPDIPPITVPPHLYSSPSLLYHLTLPLVHITPYVCFILIYPSVSLYLSFSIYISLEDSVSSPIVQFAHHQSFPTHTDQPCLDFLTYLPLFLLQNFPSHILSTRLVN